MMYQDQPAMPRGKVSLSVVCVTYLPDMDVLRKVLKDISAACNKLDECDSRIIIVDNSDTEEVAIKLQKLSIDFAEWTPGIPVQLIAGHGNVGFGRAHNIGLQAVKSDFHLVINPDVYVEDDALRIGLEYMLADPQVALVAPAAIGSNWDVQLIAKRYPSLLVLMMRGFVPHAVRNIIAKKTLATYEYRDKIPAKEPLDIELASGCFMLLRSNVFKKLGGFCPGFFMYFEDFDLSIRIRQAGYRVVHLPGIKVQHLGGDSARKGFRHIVFFMRSALYFFNRHGWKLY